MKIDFLGGVISIFCLMMVLMMPISLYMEYSIAKERNQIMREAVQKGLVIQVNADDLKK